MSSARPTGRRSHCMHSTTETVSSSTPLRFQLQTAGELLFSRRKPMTIFFARQSQVRPDADLAGLPVQRVLFGAIDRFLAQPGDSGR